MAEQPEPYAVAFYCDRCARRSGRRRMLAVANRNPATYGGWDVAVTRRVGGAPAAGGRHPRNDGGVPNGFPKPVLTALGKRTMLLPLSPLEPAAQLTCRYRHCSAKPRVARTKLVELAELADAAGRRDAYV